jgi:hypothetical protein
MIRTGLNSSWAIAITGHHDLGRQEIFDRKANRRKEADLVIGDEQKDFSHIQLTLQNELRHQTAIRHLGKGLDLGYV